MAKYAKNRNYVPPSTKGKTVLVLPSKDKDGVVKQDWDVYIGHGLNNKHWVLEKSKWSNPFYTPKLSAKICNERYRRHILTSKHLQASLKELVGKRLGCLCPNLDECHGNVLIELLHEFFPSESEMRGYILCHQYLFFKGQRSPLSNCYVHDIKMQDGTFINVYQMYGWKKATALGERFVAKNILEERDPTKIFKLLKALARRNVPQSTEDLVYWMFLFLGEKWDSVPQFRDECFHYMNELYFEATADTFWGCGLDIKTIEQAKQREDFHKKQILGTLTGFNILGWLVKVVSLLKSGGSLLINPKTLKDVSPQCHKGLLLVRKTLAEKGVVKPSLKGYTLVESTKRKKKIPLNVIV